MTNIRNLIFSSKSYAVFLTLFSVATSADWNALNMTQGVTDISKEVYELHMLIFWICVVIGLVVFGIMFYSIENF